MKFISSLSRQRCGALVQLAAAGSVFISMGALRAEGVIGAAAFSQGGLSAEVSLVSDLGGTSLTGDVAGNPAPAPVTVISPRPVSPRERIDDVVGSDLFRNLRLALPLVAHSTVGAAVDAPAADFRPMSGQMVGIRPDPRTWGSMHGR